MKKLSLVLLLFVTALSTSIVVVFAQASTSSAPFFVEVTHARRRRVFTTSLSHSR